MADNAILRKKLISVNFVIILVQSFSPPSPRWLRHSLAKKKLALKMDQLNGVCVCGPTFGAPFSFVSDSSTEDNMFGFDKLTLV